MARIWQNGFENGHSFGKASTNTTYISNASLYCSTLNSYNTGHGISSPGRGGLGGKCLGMFDYNGYKAYLNVDLNNKLVIYVRFYFSLKRSGSSKATNSTMYSALNGTTSYLDIGFSHLDNSLVQLNVINKATGETIGTTTISDDVWGKLDIYHNIAKNGNIIVKVNNVEIANFSGDTLGSLPTSGITLVRVGVNTNSNVSASGNLYVDDMAINDNSGTMNNSWIGDSSIVEIRPTANGSLTEFTPSANSNFNNVLDDVANTTTVNTTTNDGVTDLFTMADVTGITATTKVNAINITTYSMADNLYLAHLIKSGDTVTEVGTYANTGSWKYDNTLLEKDTNGNALTTTFVNNMEVGYRSKEIS